MFASVSLCRLQLELHEKSRGTDHLRPPSQESTEIILEAGATNLETGDLFCVFHSLLEYSNDSQPVDGGNENEQFSVCEKHVRRKNIPQLKQANG